MVAIITQEQKDLLVGMKYDNIQYFNPIQDLNGNWVISQEEIDNCIMVDCMWVKDLTLSTFNPPIYNDPFI